MFCGRKFKNNCDENVLLHVQLYLFLLYHIFIIASTEARGALGERERERERERKRESLERDRQTDRQTEVTSPLSH